MPFDVSALLLNWVTVAFTVWLAWIGVKIGNKTGFVSFWRKVTKGWILVGAGRFIIGIADMGILVDPNALIDLRDVGLITILAAVILMVIGFRGFLKEMTNRGHAHGD